MPIPERLRPIPPTAEEMAEYTNLCWRIRMADPSNDDLSELLERWNRRAGTEYPHEEFRSLSPEKGIDDCVAAMLMGQPALVPDVTYVELRQLLGALGESDLSEADLSYYLRWFNVNLAGSDMSELIFRPDLWFKTDEMFHVELTPDQILAYALAKSGRRLPDAPVNVPLPYPVPS